MIDLLLIIILGVYLVSSIYLIVAIILLIEDPKFPSDIPILEIVICELTSPLMIVNEFFPICGRKIINWLGV